MKTHAEFQATKIFSGFDGIRSIAIIGVLFAHAHEPELWDLWDGQSGVKLFFTLSGFLITTLILREIRDTGRFSYPAFLVRRAFRLFPIYYVVLSLYVIHFAVGPDSAERIAAFWDQLPKLIFYLQELATPIPIFYQGWSLGLEEKFYVVWPVLAFVWFKSLRYKYFYSLILIAMMIVGLSYAFPWYPAGGYVELMVGSVTAILLNDPAWFRRFLSAIRNREILVVIIVAFIQWNDSADVVHVPNVLLDHLMYAIGATLGVATIAVGGLPRLAALLDRRFFLLLGRYSYCIYLVHVIVKVLVVKVLPEIGSPRLYSFAGIVCTLMGSMVVAALSDRLLETPMRSWGYRLAARIKASE